MRLLNTNTYKLQDFEGRKIPEYAILSHRWTDNEITYQDLANIPKTRFGNLQHGDAERNVGIYKIGYTCAVARQNGIEWVWIDTCCIDKTNNTEVAKSINSMFNWYQRSRVCYAYLFDVSLSSGNSRQSFVKSKWFSRGWTLQELLAPTEIVFFDQSWQIIGTASELSKEIQAASNISMEHLKDFRKASIATKMSWASKRETTLVEDMAYCLLGIFDVTMDLRYGEEEKAFLRLQEEIIEKNPDESIFAWTSDKLNSSGLLAPWPDCFKNSHDVILRPEKYRSRGSYSMTNQGLRFPAPMFQFIDQATSPFDYFRSRRKRNELSLQCWRLQAGRPKAISIKLRRVGANWERYDCHTLDLSDSVKLTSYRDFHQRYWAVDIYILQKENWKR